MFYHLISYADLNFKIPGLEIMERRQGIGFNGRDIT
jgi:hypothetical protein